MVIKIGLIDTTKKPLNQNKMKQTAVEWLFNELDLSQEYEYAKEILDQAKEMEKEQSHAEYMRGWKDGLTKSE